MQLDPEMRIVDVMFAAGLVLLELADGRIVGAPLNFFPRLKAATPDQRRAWQLCTHGQVVHWPDLNETISARELMGHPP